MGNTTQQTAAQKAAAEKVKQEAKEKAKQEAAAQAAKAAETKDAVFDTNPQLDVYYKTSDEQAFYTQNSAELHAAELADKSIKKVTK
jgi:hypothetical protein